GLALRDGATKVRSRRVGSDRDPGGQRVNRSGVHDAEGFANYLTSGEAKAGLSPRKTQNGTKSRSFGFFATEDTELRHRVHGVSNLRTKPVADSVNSVSELRLGSVAQWIGRAVNERLAARGATPPNWPLCASRSSPTSMATCRPLRRRWPMSKRSAPTGWSSPATWWTA